VQAEQPVALLQVPPENTVGWLHEEHVFEPDV
jgi:hypothetical protein